MLISVFIVNLVFVRVLRRLLLGEVGSNLTAVPHFLSSQPDQPGFAANVQIQNFKLLMRHILFIVFVVRSVILLFNYSKTRSTSTFDSEIKYVKFNRIIVKVKIT